MPERNRIYQQLLLKLEAKADPQYQVFAQKLNPGIPRILGVRMPSLRKIAAAALQRPDAAALLEPLPSGCTQEELLIQAIAVARVPPAPGPRLEAVKAFLPRLNGWALCDLLCGELKFARTYPAEVFSFLKPLYASGEPYAVRFAAVMSLLYFMTREYLGEVLERLACCRCSTYYASQGVAWALAEAFFCDCERTAAFLREGRIEEQTLGRCLRKIRESRKLGSGSTAVLQSLRQYFRPTARAVPQPVLPGGAGDRQRLQS